MRLSKRVFFYEIADDTILMLNSLTGAVDIIDSRIYRGLQDYEGSEHTGIDEDTTRRLQKRGYLVESAEKETEALERLGEAFSRANKRLSFVVCPTYSCNLRCTYCFEGDLPGDSRSFMDEADIAPLFDAIDGLMGRFAGREFSIELFGGEPLLPKTKGFVSRVFTEAEKRSLPVGIVTNGVHLQAFAEELKANKSLIRSVQLTLDGPKQVHDSRRKNASGEGSFDAVCSAIDTLLAMEVKTVVRVNIDGQNIEELPRLVDDMVARGWVGNPHFTPNLSPVQDHSFAKGYEYLLSEDRLVERVFALLKSNPDMRGVFQLNMFRTLAHIKSVLDGKPGIRPFFHYCEANNLENMVFGPDGKIYACTEAMGNEDLAIGHFKPALALHEEAARAWDNRSVLTLEKCRECDIALLCGGGCAYSALSVNGDIKKPVCNRARETILAYLDYMKDELIDKASA